MDENKAPLPFATLHIKNTTSGTTSNVEGFYSIDLPPGTYNLIFQYVGYKSENIIIQLETNPVELNVILQPEVFQLKEVVVKAGGEDPAYEIIRNTIKNRKRYLNEVEAYTCDVYIKGLQRLDQAPATILGIPVNLDTGIVYLSESISKFSYRQPDKIREEMISSKVSGDNKAFSYNQASEMMFSIYEKLIQVEGLNDRGFISPIANNAFSYYNYALDGSIEEDGFIIYKISVSPKRKNDPVFTGKIYIVEDSWRVHSLDFLLTKDNQIEFVDSLTVKQVYAQVEAADKNSKPWMMLSQHFNFTFRAFGFVGNGYFIGIHSDYNLNPDFPARFFSNEILTITEESNKQDSAYWKKVRPVPLTAIEEKDYQEKDSISILKESRPYLDSLDRKFNRLKAAQLLFTGYINRNSFKKKNIIFDPIIRVLQYNIVEGFSPNIKVQYLKNYENRSFFRITPAVRYGFSNERLNAQLEALYYYNPLNFSFGAISFGRFIEQYNDSEPIHPFLNSMYTLLAEQNFMKLYGKNFIGYRHRVEIHNGIMATAKLEYSDRQPLENTTGQTLVEYPDTRFTSNFPDNVRLENTYFERHRAFTAGLNIRFRFAQKYISRPHQKVVVENKYPTVTLNYKKGIPRVFGSLTDFDMISLNVAHDLNLKLMGSSQFSVTGGTYARRNKMAFIDFNHFNGNRTLLRTGNNHFQLLDYYLFSTDRSWVEGHFEHHFNGFIFNLIPLVRKLGWQAILGVNYLYTTELPHYMELGFGIEHIFKIGRIEYYTNFLPHSIQEKTFTITRNGIRLGIGF
jgi:hypothetical protein